MSLWSGVGGQLLSHHVAVVRGCCHVGGQLRTRSLEEPFRGAFRKKRRFLFIKEVLIHSHFQQPFLAAILPSSSQLPFLPHQPLLSSSSQRLFSAALLAPTILIMSLWSGVGGQLWMLLRSGVGGELFSLRRCNQGLVVSHSHHVAVVRD